KCYKTAYSLLIFDELYGKIYIKFYHGKCAIDGIQAAEKRRKALLSGAEKAVQNTVSRSGARPRRSGQNFVSGGRKQSDGRRKEVLFQPNGFLNKCTLYTLCTFDQGGLSG